MRKTCMGEGGEVIKFWHGDKPHFAKTEIVVELCDLYCIGLSLLDWTARNNFFADKIASGEIWEENNG